MALFSRRTLKYGSNALSAVLIALGILAVVNFLSTRYYARYDLTQQGLYTLSQQSISLLENLDEGLTVIGFFPDAEGADFERLLEQ